MSAQKYHERFATALADALPGGFDVHADAYLVRAGFGTAALIGYVPDVSDKRKPVEESDVTQWIEYTTRRLRSDMYHYTAQAEEAGSALLAALEGVSA